ncbi:MAG: hypothetical protein QOD43_783 [Gaiellaceae bacterium]|jgi:hypothetical protein|nr:hypothetical protein [Gaiellaceae bacterium]
MTLRDGSLTTEVNETISGRHCLSTRRGVRNAFIA